MSQPGREFRLQWKTAVNEFTVQVSIYETDFLIGDSDTPEVILLQASKDPLIFSTVDNDRNKYTKIRAKEAKITFESGDYDINTFFDGADNKWLVVITLPDTSVTLFKGFLILNDMQQAFMPDPQTVTLTATDRLGSLKDVALLNQSGDVHTGKNLLSIFYADCFKLTGLDLEHRVQYNLREITSPSFHFFWKNYLDALTFEDEVGTLENAYSVLEKMNGWMAFSTQYKGEWFTKRIDEFTNDGSVASWVALFDSGGNFTSISNSVTYNQNIGALTSQRWARADQLLGSDRPNDNAKLTFRYETPKELPCNNDFDRGDVNFPYSGGGYTAYDLDCWTLYENRPLVTSTTSAAFIRRAFNANGTETERFVTIAIATALIEQILVSSLIEVQELDKFDFSFDARYNGQVETTPGFMRINLGQVHLIAHDGTYYTLRGGSSANIAEWVECDSNFNTFQRFFVWEGDGADDHTQWKNVGFWTGQECPPIPKAGYIRLCFTHQNKVNEFELQISSLRFELIPYIDGSYRKFTGHFNKVKRSDTGYLANKDEQVYLDDMPHPVYKGSIFRFNSDISRYVLTTQYFDYSKDPLASVQQRFSWWQAFDVWNQYKAGSRILEGSILGLNDTNPPDVVHQYIILSADGSIIPNLLPRTYMCVGFEQNWKTEEWRGAFIECYNGQVGREYDDEHQLKYLTN